MGSLTTSVCTDGGGGYRPGGGEGKNRTFFPSDDLAHPFRVRDRETYFKAGRHGHLTICIAMNLRALSVILLSARCSRWSPFELKFPPRFFPALESYSKASTLTRVSSKTVPSLGGGWNDNLNSRNDRGKIRSRERFHFTAPPPPASYTRSRQSIKE